MSNLLPSNPLLLTLYIVITVCGNASYKRLINHKTVANDVMLRIIIYIITVPSRVVSSSKRHRFEVMMMKSAVCSPALEEEEAAVKNRGIEILRHFR